MTRTPIPQDISQRAQCAANDAARINATLTGYTTIEALNQAEQACNRVIDNARALKTSIRYLRKEARDAAKADEADRAGRVFA
jgi:hypothetical protein